MSKNVYQKQITKEVLIIEMDLILRATIRKAPTTSVGDVNPAMLAIQRGLIHHTRCRGSCHTEHLAAKHTVQSRGESDS